MFRPSINLQLIFKNVFDVHYLVIGKHWNYLRILSLTIRGSLMNTRFLIETCLSSYFRIFSLISKTPFSIQMISYEVLFMVRPLWSIQRFIRGARNMHCKSLGTYVIGQKICCRIRPTKCLWNRIFGTIWKTFLIRTHFLTRSLAIEAYLEFFSPPKVIWFSSTPVIMPPRWYLMENFVYVKSKLSINWKTE